MSSSEQSSQKKEKDPEKQSPPAKPPPPSALRALLFRPRRTYKTWIRCSVVLAVTVILLVDPRTSNVMGQAGFFAAIVAVFLPPTFALSVFFMAAFTVLLGMLIGWAWASAAMASALSVRSPSLLAQQQQHLQSLIDPTSSTPVQLQIQLHTFHGIFLDPRSSAVYGAFLFIGTFALGVLRAYIPRFTLMSLFGTIVIDVIATIGPLFPTAQYTLAKLFLIPVTFYVAVAVASLVVIFPESLNHVWLTSLQDDFITPTHELLTLLTHSLATSPSSHPEWQSITDQGNAIRTRLVGGTENLLAQIGLIDLDTSVGRLGPQEIRRVCGELKGFLIRAAGLHSFHTFVNDKNRFDEEAEKMLAEEARWAGEVAQKEARRNANGASAAVSPAQPKASTDPNAPCHPNLRTTDTFHRLRCKIAKRERAHGHDFDSLLPILSESSLALREACEEGLTAFAEWVGRVNSNRWAELFVSLRSISTMHDPEGGCPRRRREKEGRCREMEGVVGRLEERLREFRTAERERLVRPYERFFDRRTRRMIDGHEEGEFTSRSLYISFVFIDTLDAFSESLLKMLRVVLSIDKERRRVRVWFPGWTLLSPKKLKEQVVGQGEGGERGNNPMSMGTCRDPTTFADDGSSVDVNKGSSGANTNTSTNNDDDDDPAFTSNGLESTDKPRLNPDAFPPSTPFGKFWVSLCAFLRFLKTPEGIFGLRNGVVSVALWVPSVCSASAWVYYDHKGLWALIMAQMALAVYAGDQIAGFVIRMLGTVIGLVIGMALWYMGAGRGNGNPYAIVVVTTVFLSPFLYMRIVGSPRFAALWIMIPLTGVFVVGYSWINANMFLISHPGIGVTLGWRRALLVMIGFTAAFIVMFFPNPQSSRVLVRKTASSIISELGRILAGEIEAFLAEEARARRGIDEKVVFMSELEDGDEKVTMKERRVRRVGRRVVEVSTKLRDVAPSLETAKFEPQLSGVWPQNEYRMLLQLQNRTLSSLVLLISSFEKLDTKHCGMLVHQTPYLNPNFIADIFSTLSILSSSLQTGTPLPPYLPKLRERLLYHEQRSGHGGFRPSRLLRNPGAGPYSVMGGEKVDRVQTVGVRGLLEDEEYEEKELESLDGDGDILDDLDVGVDGDGDTDVKGSTTPTTAGATTTVGGDDDSHKIRPEKIDGVTMGLDEITLDTLLDEQLPAYSTAIVALSSIIFRIDAMTGIVRTLCGETTIPGYVNLQRDYFDWEERMVGGNGMR
ncbi:hypothetical protein BJ165DRAFT_257137 [Panaeolus papilionaceus]|nr:hypothetical protein BJ165DRAFT_257137 [Panaeolus papilionaceus]